MLNEQASNILKLAVLEARIQSTQRIDVQHILLAILHDNVENGAKEVLQNNNLNYATALEMLRQPTNPVQDGIGMADVKRGRRRPHHEPAQRQQQNARTAQANMPRSNTPVFDNFGTDLTKAAAEGKSSTVVGREKGNTESKRDIKPRKKNNPILIGEPGVGKKRHR